MGPQISQMINEAREAIVQKAGDHLRLLVLYGSEARGEATPESDIDILALLDVDDPKIKRSLKDAVYNVMWRYDFLRLISLHFMTASEFRTQAEQGYSFARNVEEEGIILWRTAA